MRDMSEAEFDAALAQCGDTVYRLAFAYTRNRADADDVFQEVFLRYFRRAPAFETEEHRKAWLLRVTINRAKSCLSRRVLHGPPQAEGAVPFSAPASMELHEALSKLAPKYRTVTAQQSCRPLSFKDSSIGTPAVPLGSPASLERCSSLCCPAI